MIAGNHDFLFEDDVPRSAALIPNGTDILITHRPSQGILDLTTRGEIAGCEDLMRPVERVRPKQHVFGRIHEGYGMIKKNGTCFVNACNAAVRYRMRNLAVVVEI